MASSTGKIAAALQAFLRDVYEKAATKPGALRQASFTTTSGIELQPLYVPRDFDISPYFKIVKPMLEESFDYKGVHWADLPTQSEQYIGTSRTSRKMKRQRCAQLSPCSRRPGGLH